MEGHHPDFHLTSYRNIQVVVLHGAEVVSSQTPPICPYFLGGDSDSPDCETNSRNTILSQFLTWRLFVWPLMGMKFNLDLLRETWVLMTSEWAPSYTIQVSSKPSFTIDINRLQTRVVSFSMAPGFVKSIILVFSIFFHVFPLISCWCCAQVDLTTHAIGGLSLPDFVHLGHRSWDRAEITKRMQVFDWFFDNVRERVWYFFLYFISFGTNI